jgi:catechol 2,3-dioxygenase-like lactoylglutathione lyase family enzyme
MNVEHIGLYAGDSAALAKWYEDVVGLRVVNRIDKPGRPPIVFLQGADGAVLEILPTSAGPSPDGKVDRRGFTHLGLPVKDFEKEKARLAGRGVEVWGVRSTSNGWTIGYFRDLEGNVLELIQR